MESFNSINYLWIHKLLKSIYVWRNQDFSDSKTISYEYLMT